jgi:hypothetical protein
MNLALLSLVLLGCATAPEPPPPSYDYGGLRQPSELQPKIEQAQPVVPPAGKPEEPAPRPDPCARPCATYRTADAESDRLAARCQKHQDELGHTNTDACRKKIEADQKYIAAKNNLGACSCD